MKRSLIICMLMIAMSACAAPKAKITVTNDQNFARRSETVALKWSEITTLLPQATAENIVVMEGRKQIPSQLIKCPNSGAVKQLLFQASVDAASSSTYILALAEREDYPTKVFGRYVPERKDDYAWENDLVAFRLYGPALTDPVAPGIDVWVKCTDSLIIDKWYKRGNYHHNYGQGMDCYKVGKTLGGGASAPYVDGQLWLSANYTTQKCVLNGPIRTQVVLTYAPFDVDGRQVSLTKVISLDAGSRFSKVVNLYKGDFETLPVAAGVIMHKVKDKSASAQVIAITEEASDSKQPAIDGDISLAVVMPKGVETAEVAGHLVVVGNADNKHPLTYYHGSGWSQGGVADAAAWKTMAEEQLQKVQHPLKVELSAK